MINKDDLSLLSKFQSGGYFVSSLYLNVDGKRFKKKDYEIKLKALIKERKQEIDGLGLNQEAQNSVLADFDRITEYINFEFDGRGVKSLSIFSCQGLGFWKVFSLPHAVHPRYVISKLPYIRPLVSLLSDHKRYLAIFTGREKARLFEYYLEELNEYSQILNEVPGQIKVAGWYGLDERRIERRIEDKVHQHFKNVAEGVFQYNHNYNPDHIIIGGRKEIISEFEQHLHTNIQSKIIARIKLDLEASAGELTRLIKTVVDDFESEEQARLIKKLFDEKGRDGLGVTGLKATLRALWNGQVNILFIPEDFSKPGYYCPQCWYMSDNEENCANDHTPMKLSHDIIEDAVETAIFQNCEIVRLKDQSVLSGEHENIGALLRFKY